VNFLDGTVFFDKVKAKTHPIAFEGTPPTPLERNKPGGGERGRNSYRTTDFSPFEKTAQKW